MSKSLGKRKERDPDVSESTVHGSTVFVSNLPYSATSTDIKTLFSDIGPVRSAFVVLDQTSGSSKGVGYVSFAIREDAQLAYDTVNGGEGLSITGRKLRVDWAGSKPHKEQKEKTTGEGADEGAEKKPTKSHAPKAPRQHGPNDPLAHRTIVISGLPSGIDSNALWKKVRKYKGAEKVEWPVTVNAVEDASAAHVIFSNPSAAHDGVTKLHAHVYKGALLSVTLKKRLDVLATAPAKTASTSAAKGDLAFDKPSKSAPAPSRASRLIVRNLPFNITDQDLRAVFLPYGPIHSIHIPVSAPEPKEEDADADAPAPALRAKGYAFVWMLSKQDAEKALAGANGAKVHAGMADGLVRNKQKRKKQLREEAKLKQRELERKARGGKKVKEEDEDEGEDEDEEGAGEAGESDAEEEGEGENETESAERVIAVDWALSKDKWEEAKAKLKEEEEAEKEDGDRSDEEGSGSGGDEEGSHLGVHDGSDDESGSDDDEDSMEVDEDEKPGKPTLPPPETGTTLFVRNVPYEATEDELRTVFRAFGPLRYARITMDHELGRSRGTGFVCFWNKEDADKAIEQSDILRQETTGTASAVPKKNPFKLPSLLTPDPSASVAQNLVLHGRTMDVIRAVTRDEAGKLKEAGERQREKADKRHLYLLREGLIMPNTPAAESLSTAEVEKRTASFNARKALLRSNPSLYVSRTRLSIRQIPVFVTERMLKRLAIHAVRTFKAEVKEGIRSPLTADELAEPVEDDGDERADSKGKAKAMPAKKGRNTSVKQSKIVRQHERVDPVTGKGRSKGYAFLEMEKHPDALRVLRWANNNPAVGKLFDEWWKEELQGLLKSEKEKEKKEEGRMEKIKAELEQVAPKKSKGTLIAEFSIENVQVVKRRAAHQQEQTGPDEKRKGRRSAHADVKEEATEQESRPRKKPRVSDPPAVKEETSGNKMGALIGRKRKERREKRKH